MRSGLKAAGLALALLLDGGALAQEQAEAPAPITRPAPPRRPDLPLPTDADCEVPATRDALLADPEAVIMASSQYARDLNLYTDQLMNWWSEQLIQSGRWTEQDKSEFGMRILQDPEFGREFEAGLDLVGEVMEPAMLIGDESRPADERCRAIIAAQQAFDGITASVEVQWGIINRLFAVEAARLGVSLE